MSDWPWSAWQLPIRGLQKPAEGVVDLWLSNVSTEGAKARRFQQQFVLRLILGAYLGQAGKAIKLVRNAQGKPMLDARLHGDTALHFNVSHSGPWWGLAVSCEMPVGLDLELSARRIKSPVSLAERFFDAETVAYLKGLDDEQALAQAFLRHWTAREAVVKAMGLGLARGLNGLALSAEESQVSLVPADWPQPSQWQVLHRIDVPDLTVAVAAAQAPFTLQPRRLTWPVLSPVLAGPTANPGLH